jgi:peptidoglycan/xylan/chitin deacetylase (PgdA/CDA1 family)
MSFQLARARAWRVGATVAIAVGSLFGSTAQAASPPTVLDGPPQSDVLATVPAPPVPASAAAIAAKASATCPDAPYGVNHYAPGSGKTVALTFDDGPGVSTSAILDILSRNHIPSTFFDIGVNMKAKPQVVLAQATAGVTLGNHTWDHPQMQLLTPAEQAAEMDGQIAQQMSLLGTAPCLFRPPYGSYNDTTLQLAQARHMVVWNWSVDTEDWKADGSGSPYWVDRITTRAIAGGTQAHPVILMHNSPTGNPATVAALQPIIDYYRSHGYTFVALGAASPPPPPQSAVVVGDWDGNGTTTPGFVRHGSDWLLRDSNSSGPANHTFGYGVTGDRDVAGDWDGNGTVTPGVVRGNIWYLRNSLGAGPADLTFGYGQSTDRVVVGDWDGNGTDTPGVVRGNVWYLRDSLSAGPADHTFGYGKATDRLVAGDWDGDGTFSPGVIRGNVWYLRNSLTGGASDFTFGLGASTDRQVVGDWDGNKTSTPGVVRGNLWLLRNTSSGGAADYSFTYGAPTD